MGRTPDPIQGSLDLPDLGEDPTEVGQLARVGSDIKAVDGSGLFNLRSGSGLTEAAHELLDTLAHDVVESCYEEATRVDGRVSAITYWDSASKTTKIRELAFTRSGGRVTQVDAIQYDAAGVESYRMAGTVARVDGRYASTTWVRTNA